ncbi:MAG TPA: hypothetical protein VJG49_04385 [Candidatus Nanoarchaeia archaeon]|nr:hypothetical protein [Candidatus Nanoarchaeia archaeon]
MAEKIAKKKIVRKIVNKQASRQKNNFDSNNNNSNNKPFWIGFGILLIFSFVMIIVFSQNNLTGRTIQNIALMPKGSELFMEAKVDGLKDLTIHFSEQVKNAQIIIQRPQLISWKLPGVELARFTISFTDEDKVSRIDLRTKIREDKITSAGLSKEELKFYLNGQELETTLEKIDGSYVFYTASSAELGEFVIGKKEVETTLPAVEETGVIEPSPTEPETQQPAPVPAESLPTSEPEPESFVDRVLNTLKNIFN